MSKSISVEDFDLSEDEMKHLIDGARKAHLEPNDPQPAPAAEPDHKQTPGN